MGAAERPEARPDRNETALPASFRDPAGFVFERDGILYRRVTMRGYADYRSLMDSGLYAELTSAGLLIPHDEVSADSAEGALLQPERVRWITYPYEWSFGQLQDAALATLEIQKRALDRGLWLKDATAYNIQFHRGRPVFIDTLSFEPYREGSPWPAYKQFCQHFVAPLALMSYVDSGLGQMLRLHLDGVPLEIASRLLPARTRVLPGLMTHLHLHAAAQRHYSAGPGAAGGKSPRITRTGMLGILDGLRGTVSGLTYSPKGTEWGDYYGNTNYTDAAMDEKQKLVGAFLDAASPTPRTAWDLGANNGAFSRLASARGIDTVAWDIDPAAVEQNWRACKARGETRLLPLLQDLVNPSPALGWAGEERESFLQRGPADIILALALIHHLAITNNVPLTKIAELFARVTSAHAVVEWVPAEDSQTKRLLARRDGEMIGYDRATFEAAFAPHFTTVLESPVAGTERRLYLFRKRTAR
jgi:ribosomal protein L11 methylase PrmA